jgi:proteasome accessory factor B
MIDPAERLVNLALLLAATPRHVTAEQCRAAGLGYPESQDGVAFIRMFERDKEALRASGLVIDVATDPHTDVEAYRLDAEATFARPIDLAGDEVSSLRAVAAALADDPSFPFREDLALALGKLGAAGHDRPMATTQLVGSADPEIALHVEALAEAVRLRKGVTFDYTNSNGAQRARHVDPYGLFFREGQWYLTGCDTDKHEIRTYAVERLRSLDVNPARPRTPDFERPAGFDVRQQERLPFQYGPVMHEVRIRFEPDLAWRAERLSRGHGSIEMLSDGSAVWTVEAADLERLASWIVDEGPGLHAVQPPELLSALADGLRRVVDAHG